MKINVYVILSGLNLEEALIYASYAVLQFFASREALFAKGVKTERVYQSDQEFEIRIGHTQCK